jgi:tripartite-type tricarboxylate transporter receptor subunit TctC
MMSKSAVFLSTTSLIFALSAIASAHAETDFYKGKTVEMTIGYAAGSSNDIAGRVVAKYLPKYIPGSPTIITRNMPGGGSFVAGNYIYNVAPKDGTILGLLAPTIAIDEKLGTSGVKFVASKFNWIGRVTTSIGVSMVWAGRGITNINDAFVKESSMAATGAGSTTAIYPNVLNNILGTKFRLIMGYNGSNEAMLAMERGEADGHSVAWEQVTSQHMDWFQSKKILVLVQYGLKRHPDLPDVPTAVELAKTPEQAKILTAVVSASDVGKSIITTPDVPQERVTLLRRAFDQVVKDPDYLAEMRAQRIEPIPLNGEDLQKIISDLGTMSPELINEVKKVYVMPGAQ